MTRSHGQAAREGAMHAAHRLHFIGQICLGFLMVSLLAVGGVAVRLSQGPLSVAWLARQAAVALSGEGRSVTVGGAEIAWEGFRTGVDRPVDIVLRHVAVTVDGGGNSLEIARAAVSLSLFEAVQGRFVPRALELDGVRAATDLQPVDMSAPGVGNADWRTQATDMIAALRAPRQASGEEGATLWGQLRRVRVLNAHIALRDAASGVSADLSRLRIEVERAARGGAEMTADGTLRLGEVPIDLHASAALPANEDAVEVALGLSPFTPSDLAGAAPLFAPLALARLSVTLNGTLALAGDLSLRSAALDISAAAGSVLLGQGAVPLQRAAAHIDLTPDTASLDLRQLVLQATPSTEPTDISATVVAHRAAFRDRPGVAVDLEIKADRVAVDDMPTYWPAGIGGPGTRPWLVANVHGGTVRDAHVGISLTAPLDFSDAAVSRLEGAMDGSDSSVTWLSGVPPLEHTAGHMVFTGPDTMDIQLSNARQSGTAIVTKRAVLHFSGLAGHDQFMSIDGDIDGPLADVVGLLRQPRIRLMQKSNLTVLDPSGQVVGKLTVNMPLKNNLKLDDVAIGVTGQISDAHVGGIAAGRDLDHAALNFSVDNKGLKLSGAADIAGVPASLAGSMDFRDVAANQIAERVDIGATLSARQLAEFGLAHGGALKGNARVQFGYQSRRNGDGELEVNANLAGMEISDPRMVWRKPAAAPGTLELHGLLHAGALSELDNISVDAPGLVLRGSASFSASRGTVVRLDTIKAGDATDLRATLRLPHEAGGVTDITLDGAAIDISRLVAHRSDDNKARGPAFHVAAHLARVTMANGQVWRDLSADIANDGLITSRAVVDAKAGAGDIALSIGSSAGGRALSVRADDAGALLGALDISQRVVGGRLAASGNYDDAAAGSPLEGSADMEDFRVRDAPAMVRLLQAMSLYGLLDVARGPGLGFTRLVSPFGMSGDTLTLRDARAYSASLGFTAKGGIDLASHVADIDGTVVPLYFFNSLLGKIPLLGRMFSPEADGGLFAVNYAIRGSLDDPKVSVNPLSVVTPGVLRGFFDIFGNGQSAPPEATPPK
jgi:hypothetical protein